MKKRQNMQTSSYARRSRRLLITGFTLLEVLVVMAVFAVLTGVGLTISQSVIKVVRMESRAQQMATVIQRARMEAIQRQVATYVEIDPTTGVISAYADIHDEFGELETDFIYNPQADMAERETDYLITSFDISPASFGGPPDAPAEDQEPVVDFSLEDGRQIAIFEPAGVLVETGAFRITSADEANSLEISLETRSGLVETRKYIWDGPRGSRYYARASDNGREEIWVWY